MINWLYQTSVELSLLILLVIMARPLVRHFYGAQLAYYLWLIPLLGMFLNRPQAAPQIISLPNIGFPLQLYGNAEALVTSSSFPWFWLWLTGACLVGLIFITRFARLQRSLRSAISMPELESKPIESLLENFRSRSGEVFATSLPAAPFLTGLNRPKLFLPEDFFERFTAQEQSWVVKHELAHLQRRDLHIKLVVECIRTVFWFTPLIHIAARLIGHDQELACDQEVVSHCSREERYEYGKALMKGSSAVQQHAIISYFGNSLFGNQKERYIMLEKHQKSFMNTFLGLTCCALIGALVLAVSPSSMAQQTASDVSNTQSVLFTVSSQGEVRVGGQIIPNQDLGSTIREALIEMPNFQIVIQAAAADLTDPNNAQNPSNASIMAIMDAARTAGIRNLSIQAN